MSGPSVRGRLWLICRGNGIVVAADSLLGLVLPALALIAKI
jgi:hypothetical protein